MFGQLINIIKRTPGSLASSEPGGEEFEAAEHENIGNQVKLQFPGSGRGGQEVLGADRPLRLPNGLQLCFGQIIALAGDFYGVPEHPIIDPSEDPAKIPAGRRDRFTAAYSTLANGDYKHIKKELDQILKIMTKERSEVEAALESKERKVAIPSKVYEELGHTLVEKWDKATGGYWAFGVPLIFGRIMKLAQNNHDHFLPYAKDAYLAGHELALEKAREAARAGYLDQKIKVLEEAYSIDAFACHFLTDSFSSGHLR